METSLTDIKKQYEKLKAIIGDEDSFDLSDEDALRCQDALRLLVARSYLYDVNANLYLKQAELDGFGDWLNEAIKESNRLKLREWLIAIVGAAVGAIITKILTG